MSNTVADKLAKKTRKKAPSKQVRLKLVYIDFWSAVKFSFLVSICLAIVGVVATILIYTVLMQTGVFSSVDAVFMDIVGEENSLMKIIGFPQVPSFTTCWCACWAGSSSVSRATKHLTRPMGVADFDFRLPSGRVIAWSRGYSSGG